MPTTPCLSQKPKKCCCYGRVSTLWTLKTPGFMARKRWRHDVTMRSENSQGYLWIPCEFYSSLANQIMCNKQSTLESGLTCYLELCISLNILDLLFVRFIFGQISHIFVPTVHGNYVTIPAHAPITLTTPMTCPVCNRGSCVYTSACHHYCGLIKNIKHPNNANFGQPALVKSSCIVVSVFHNYHCVPAQWQLLTAYSCPKLASRWAEHNQPDLMSLFIFFTN